MARHFEDLVCWRLSRALKCEVLAFTATGPISRDFKFRDQIRDSAASAPSNISQAFGRYRPREVVRFFGYACGSLAETQNHLIDALDRGYIADPLYSRLRNLARAALAATKGLLLERQRAADAADARRRAQRKRR